MVSRCKHLGHSRVHFGCLERERERERLTGDREVMSTRTLRVVSREEIEAILFVGRGEQNGRVDILVSGLAILVEGQANKSSIFSGSEEMFDGICSQV